MNLTTAALIGAAVLIGAQALKPKPPDPVTVPQPTDPSWMGEGAINPPRLGRFPYTWVNGEASTRGPIPIPMARGGCGTCPQW